MRRHFPNMGLEQEGKTLVECLGGRWTGVGGMCLCPAHDDGTPSLSIRIGEIRLLFHCFAGCTVPDVMRALKARGLLVPQGGVSVDHATFRRVSGNPGIGTALRLWEDARTIAGTLAQRYLSSRAISRQSPELRFLWRTPHGPRPLTRFRPALIAAVRDESGLVAVHRTFLDARETSLTGIAGARCGLGRFGTGAVRLGGIARRIGLAEGIETALSASQLFGLPCWATLGTERFRLIALPPDVRELVLFLDNDPAGRRAERLAREAFAQRLTIECRYPPRSGDDWNDVLRTKRDDTARTPALEEAERRGSEAGVSDGSGLAAPAHLGDIS